VRKPDSVRSVTHSGATWPSGRLSFTSSTAWGKRVMSVRGMGWLGSRYHLNHNNNLVRADSVLCRAVSTTLGTLQGGVNHFGLVGVLVPPEPHQ